MQDSQSTRGGAVASPGDPTNGPSGKRVTDHQTGRLLDGRYRLGPRIARGGMASVYEALDERLHRTVAVKIMHPGLGDGSTQDESFARRFVREARAAAGISHPNVVAVYDQGRDESDGDTTYLVMEYVPGHTLRDTITKEAPMSPERALALLDPVLSALALAHRSGLIHRDIKPENVLIADDGRIKVADFGLAKAVSAETQHTATNGVLIGTVSYLAPELVTEQRADARADVYAVGVILFELLTGEKPHTGETPIAVAYRHVHHDVPAPSSRAPGIPAYVDALVARATTRDPSLRPADASVLLHHVRRVAGALHEGVRDDPELVADLMPSTRGVSTDVVAPEDRVDTTPEPVSSLWDGAEDLVPATPSSPPAQRGPSREETSIIAPPPPAPTPAPTRPARRRGRRIAMLLVLALLLGAIGTGGWWFGWGRYTDTPRVVGLERTAAETKIEDAGLKVEVGDEAYSETVEKGTVISTEPGPGDRILPDDTVQLTISLGPERYDLPDLRGLTVDEATESLAEVKLNVGRLTPVWSETVPEGRVIQSDPAFGSPQAKNLPVDTAIRLGVSKGPQPIKVANWVGKDAKDVEKTLTKLGLKYDEGSSEFSDTVAKGHVISQDPKTGTLFKGDTVTFVVSKGPELISVPSVRYKSTDDAVQALEDAGFKVKKERASIYLSGAVAWSTNPGSGEKARKGSTVILYVV